MINTFLYITINIVIYFIVSTSLLYLVSDVTFSKIFLIVALILALINFIVQNNIKYKRYIKKALITTYFVLFIVFLLPIGNVAKFQFVVVWLLIGYILSNNLLCTTHNKIKLQFKISIYILAIMIFLATCFNICMLAFKQVFIYIIMYYILVISINRCLRDEDNIVNRKQYYLKIIIELISSLTLVCLFYFTKFYKYIYEILLFIYNKCMSVIGFVLSYMFISIEYLVRKFCEFILLFKRDVPQEDLIKYEEKTYQMKIELGKVVRNETKIESDYDYTITVILIIIILVVGLGIWLYFNKKRKIKNDKSVVIVREKIKCNKKEKKKKKIFMNNTERVRYYYNKMLKNAKRKSTKFVVSDTTLDINNKLVRNKYNNNSLEKIRQIYMKARYSDLEILKEDVIEIRKEIKTNLKG